MVNNSVKKCCICNNEKMGEFITINDNKYHLCCIEESQQENKELYSKIDRAIEYIEENKMKGKYSHSGGEYDNFILLEECEINDLLEILKDSDVDV